VIVNVYVLFGVVPSGLVVEVLDVLHAGRSIRAAEAAQRIMSDISPFR
jgi:hypothetical protein